MKHAALAVAMFSNQSGTEIKDPEPWMQVFVLGFILGLKFNEERQQGSSSTT